MSEAHEPGMTPEERAALAKDIQERVPAIVEEGERAVRAMLNPDGTMTKPLATAYVQDLVVQFLEQEGARFEAEAADETRSEVDRKDAAACAEACAESANAMKVAITVLVRSQERVQVAPATALGKVQPIRVAGSKLPGSGR